MHSNSGVCVCVFIFRWHAVVPQVENALPVQQYVGGNSAGGYWNDGSLQLTPGMGCPGHHGAANSANCMTDARFRTMCECACVCACACTCTSQC